MSGGTAYWLSGPAAQQDQPGWFALKSSIGWPLPPCSMARASTDAHLAQTAVEIDARDRVVQIRAVGPASAEGAVAWR